MTQNSTSMPVPLRAKSHKWYRNSCCICSILAILISVSIGVSYFTLQALHQTVVIPPSAQASTHVLLIDQPKHRFHSDHWYHVGEYYISQQQSLHQQYHLQGNSEATAVVLIGNRDPKFLKKITKMVLFYIAASFGGHYDSIEIAAHDQLDGLFGEYRGTLRTSLSAALYRLRTTFNSFHRRAVIRFDVNQPLEQRFEFVTTSSMYGSRFGTNRHRILLGDKNHNKKRSSTLVAINAGDSSESNSSSLPYQIAPPPFSAAHIPKTSTTLSPVSMIGSMGRLPVDSGEWFQSDEEAMRMRRTIETSASPQPYRTETRTSSQTYRTATRASPRPYRLVIYERNNDRHIQDLGHVVALLTAGTTRARVERGTRARSRSGAAREGHDIPSHAITTLNLGRKHKHMDGADAIDAAVNVTANVSTAATVNVTGHGSEVGYDYIYWEIEVLHHSDEMDPCSLHRSLRDADLFLTTHGFQALALLFLKPGAVLVEIFPYKYFKPSYLKLAATYGIHHRWRQNIQPTSFNRQALRLVSQETCMGIRRCRSHARGDSVVVTSDDIAFVLNVTRGIEEGRLGAHNAPSLG